MYSYRAYDAESFALMREASLLEVAQTYAGMGDVTALCTLLTAAPLTLGPQLPALLNCLPETLGPQSYSQLLPRVSDPTVSLHASAAHVTVVEHSYCGYTTHALSCGCLPGCCRWTELHCPCHRPLLATRQTAWPMHQTQPPSGLCSARLIGWRAT